MSLIMPPVFGGDDPEQQRDHAAAASAKARHATRRRVNPNARDLRITREAQSREQAWDNPASRQRMESRARIEAAIGFHLGGASGGMDMSKAIRPVADQFMQLAEQEPALISALEDDVNALFALTDEDMAMRIASGQGYTQMDPVFDSITDVLWEIGAHDLAARVLEDDERAIRGTFEGIAGNGSYVLGGEGSDEVARRLAEVDADLEVTAGLMNALTGDEAAWVWDGDRGLVVSGRVDGQAVSVPFQTDGSPIESGVDVVIQALRAHERGEIDLTKIPVGDPGAGAVLSGTVGAANRIGKAITEWFPGGSKGIDTMFQLFNPIAGITRATPFQNAEADLEAKQADVRTDAVRLASVLPFPEEAVVALVAREILASAEAEGLEASGSEALAAARNTVAENREQFLTDWESMLTEDIIDEATAQLDDTSALGEIIGGAAEGTLKALETWDAWSQRLGVNTVDFVLDATTGAWQAVESQDAREGWRLFREAQAEPVPSDVAEYFGLEDDAADAALVTTGMFFDPTNALFMGPRAAGKLFAKAMTQAKFAPIMLRFGPMRSLTRTIASTNTNKAVRSVLSMSGLSDQAYLELFDLANSTSSTRKQVEDILLRELPSTEGIGFYLAEGPSRALRRSTAEGLGRWIEALPGMSPENQQEFFRTFAKLSRHRTMNLSESTFLDEFFDILVSTSPGQTDDLVRWASEAVEAVRQSRGTTDTLAGATIAQKQSARQKINNLAAQRSRFVDGDPGTLRANMAQIRQNVTNIDEMLPAGTVADVPTTVDELARSDEFLYHGTPAGSQQQIEAEGITEGGFWSDLSEAQNFVDVGRGDAIYVFRKGEFPDEFRGGASNVMDRRFAATQDMVEETVDPSMIVDIPRPIAVIEGDTIRPLVPTRSGVRQQLIDAHEAMAHKLKEVEGKVGRIDEQRKQAHKELGKAARLEGELAAPDSRVALAEVMYRWLDEQAIRINELAGTDLVPVVQNASNRLAPTVPVRDWSEVTGVKRRVGGADDELALAMGLAGDDATLASQLGQIGAFNRSVRLPLPVSPYEVVAAQRLAKSPKAWAAFKKSRANQIAGDAVSEIKQLFAFNLLLNPVTAVKTHGDETLRFLVETGDMFDFLKAQASVFPGTGRFVTNPWAAQYGRNMSGFRPDDIKPWSWVDRPGRVRQGEYIRQVERWVNGSLLNDDIFRNYARWIREGVEFVDDASWFGGRRPLAPKEFVDWWETGAGSTRPGAANARAKKLTWKTEDGAMAVVDLTADEAFAVMHQGFEVWLSQMVDEGARGQMRRTLLEAATGTRPGLRPDGPDARLLRSVQRVPGHDMSNGLFGTMFEIGFGGPSQRRGGVFFEHYFDDAFRMYREAYENKGRLLTRDMLIDRAGMTEAQADMALREGADNRFVRWLMDGAGAVTERQLEAQAARHARRRADDLLYRLSATSIAGSRVEAGLMFPFARAQADFLGWWTNHLTRPMQLRIGANARVALQNHPMLAPLRAGVEAVESIPLNVRAMAKFSHIASAMNNEHESMFDKAIDGLTFLPTRWSDEILLDLIPGFGPMPTWMIEQMFKRGVISEDVMAEIESVFPALQFVDDSDDLLGMMLPDTGRSIRSMTVGALRKIYALMGEDINRATGAAPMIANMLADEKYPTATQDFQTGIFADWLDANAFDITPGSAEWNEAASQAAVDGAVQANAKEWTSNWRSWLFGVRTDEIEYRNLPAYGAMFDDGIFDLMVSRGAFDANDLLPGEDGETPRIREVWDRVAAGEGSNEDKQWLADTLASTFHSRTSEIELLPGYTLMDHLLVQSPAMAVNLVSKSIGLETPPTDPAGRDFYRQYINPDTRRIQNVPPGPEGTEIITEARRRGWIVRRPADGPEGWMRDAHEAALTAADRGVRAAWKAVTGRDWGMDSTFRTDPKTGALVPGVKKDLQNASFTVPGPIAQVLEMGGLEDLEGQTLTVQQFREILDDHRRNFAITPPDLRGALEGNAFVQQLERHNDDMGRGLVQNVQKFADVMRDAGISSVEEWPQEIRDHVREQVSNAITAGYVTQADYDAHWRRLFGDLNYEPPVLPPVEDLEFGIQVTADEVKDGSVAVTDGDGLSLLTEDGSLRVRLLGINAPEAGQDGHAEATRNLERLLARADDVVLGVYKPEVFGVTQASGPGDTRMFAFLYVDGVPIYDPTVFTAENPRGAGVGGRVLDLEAIYEAGQ